MDSDDESSILGVDAVLGILCDATQTDAEAAAASSGSKPQHSKPAGLRPGWKCLKFGLRSGKAGKKVKKLTKQQALLDTQARAYNTSGRSRNADYHMPLHEHRLQRQDSQGSGGWKTWSVPAILRAGLSDEKSACRQLASSIEGAGFVHASRSRSVVAEAIMSGQRSGFKRLESELSQETKPLKLKYAIKNIMRDESTFELSFQDCIRASYSILGFPCSVDLSSPGPVTWCMMSTCSAAPLSSALS